VSESRTVLIVEDEFAIAELLEMVLTDEGYRVLTGDCQEFRVWGLVQ
jgi:DNA-binding response OmpR family regulator